MKTKSLKAFLFLAGMILFNANSALANAGEKFNQFVNSGSDYQGFYIILGVVAASLITYLIVNHFNKEESEEKTSGTIHHHHHHRRHHHHHRIVKKTS